MTELVSYERNGPIATTAMDDGKVNTAPSRRASCDRPACGPPEALAELDSAAPTATKLRARARALEAVRRAIETELTPENLRALKAA